MDNSNSDQDPKWGTGVGIKERSEEKTKRPPMYTVLVHNDPFTLREFVSFVLMRFFQKTLEQANKVMMIAHTQGRAAAGTYTKEIAETKVHAATSYCRAEGQPLQFTIEEGEV